MVLAIKNGAVVCRKNLDDLKRIDGIGKAGVEIDDAEFAAQGGIARVIDGKIFIGHTDAEKAAESNPQRVMEINARLQDIDARSARPARAVALAAAGGKEPDAFDVKRLNEYEAESAALRTELQSLL